MMARRYFVTGIGTGVGKTLVSALLCEHLKADYFKPIQTGYPPDRDSEWIRHIVSYSIHIHPENYLLKLPASPHLAAKREGIHIQLQNIELPYTQNHLIIEGAGGLLVPINHQHYIVDFIQHFQAECILVVSNYLGCINHSLLSLYYIQKERIPLKGIVLNGNFDEEVKEVILSQIHPSLLISEIPFVETLDKYTFSNLYKTFQSHLKVIL